MDLEYQIKAAILKATNERLRSDNWQLIIDACDLVREDPEDGGEYAMEVIEGQLEQKDANINLRTLPLIVALAENCGSRLQQAICSKHFTGVLRSIVEDKKKHTLVRQRVAKMVAQLAESLKNDPSLKSIRDLNSSIRTAYPALLEQPNIPGKKDLSSESREREERELEQALKASLQDFELSPKEESKEESKEKTHSSPNFEGQYQSQPPIQRVRALYDLVAREPDELSFKRGDVIMVVEQVYCDWWRGSLRGKIGIFPLNYVSEISEPNNEQLRQEAEEEQKCFEQKSNIDRLQKTMQAAGGNFEVTQDPEVNRIYGNVTPLRPQITKLLGKYAQRRDDLASLRQLLSEAEASYNQMLDRAYAPLSPKIETSPYRPSAPRAPDQRWQLGGPGY
ncbi:LAMI_0G03730g1_1 [Lachancea mirantina]|uniref:Class E vacuolar protein-sorting machinery protein HSE1 n=1 Tax=Lachancea mirantina TaxID=1230905 RepID=A0A1G4K891_9SACH|nr:LAMI_0G03730g1_1 [Lachancea mirantina]